MRQLSKNEQTEINFEQPAWWVPAPPARYFPRWPSDEVVDENINRGKSLEQISYRLFGATMEDTIEFISRLSGKP